MSVDNRYEFLKKLGVGFDHLFKVVDGLGSEYFSEDYPPYNIVQTDAETFVVQVSMVGYNVTDVGASHEGGLLVIKATETKEPAEADDVYFHKGIADGNVYVKFPISSTLRLEGSVFDGGVLYVTYKLRKAGEPMLESGVVEVKDALTVKEDELFKVLPDSGKVKFDSGGRAKLRKQRMGFRRYMYNSAGKPVGVMDLDDPEKIDEAETEALMKTLGHKKEAAKEHVKKLKEADLKIEDKLAKVEEKIAEKSKKIEEKLLEKEEKAEKKEEKKAEIAEKKAEKKADKKEVTVEVSAPDNKPQIIEAKVDKKGDSKIDVELKDATIEVSDDVVLLPVKTEAGKADVVVALKEDDKKLLDEAKVDIVDTVKEVVDALDAAPKLPEKTEKAEEKKTVLVDKEKADKPTVEVTLPKEIPSVVELKKDDKPTKADIPAVKLEDTVEDIKEDAVLLPVVMPEGKPDVVVAVDPVLKDELEAKDIDVKGVVESAAAEVVEEVKTSEPVDEVKLEEADKAEVVAEVEEKKADIVLVNKEDDKKETLEVKKDLVEDVPVVELKIDEENKDAVTDMPPLKVEDAMVEVSDDAELVVVKTEEGKSDVVVAAAPEVVEVLEKAKTDLLEVAKEIVDAPELVDEPKVVIDEETKEEIEIHPEDVTVLVDKTDDEKPTVEMTLPDVVEPIMEVVLKDAPEIVVEEPAVELKPVAEDIPADGALMPVVTPDGQPDMVVVAKPEVVEELKKDGVKDLAEVVEKAINQADVLVDAPVLDEAKVEEASKVEAVVEKLDEIAKEPATIVVDKDSDKPTVEVTLAAEESPQVVAVKLDDNPANKEIPSIVVEDATIEVGDNKELLVIKTDEDKADVVIAIDPIEKEALETEGVVIEEVVKDALETNDALPEVPAVEEEVEPVTVMVDKMDETKDTVEVTTPEVLPQVVEAVLDPDPANNEIVSVDLVDVKEDIPEDAELVAVVTPEGQPDLIVAVDKEVEAAVEDVVEVLEKAVNIADVEVVPTDSTTVKDEDMAEAMEVEEVVEKLDEIAKEPATLLIDETSDKPTVEVTLAAEEAPQLLEVKLDEKPSSDAPAIILEDATVEVKADEVELIPVKTDEGMSDVVLAVEPAVKAELEDKGVVLEEVVKAALETNDSVPVLPEATVTAPLEKVVVDDVTVEMPEVLPQLVELEKEGDKLVLTDTSEDILPEAKLEVVETPAGEADIVMAVEADVVEAVKAKGLDPVKLVEKAIDKVKPTVETVVEADLPEPEPVGDKPIVVVKKPGA